MSPYSAPARFEMGLLSRPEWKGRWITGTQLRKEFRLPSKVVRARLYVTALGYYEVHLNGARVGENVLDPAWTSYDKRVLYSTYDVTPALQQRDNAVGVTLGGGWATLGTGMLGGRPYYDRPALLLQMKIELEEGKHISVATDNSWQSRQGPIVSDSVYGGEVYGARLESPGSFQVGTLCCLSGQKRCGQPMGYFGEVGKQVHLGIRARSVIVAPALALIRFSRLGSGSHEPHNSCVRRGGA